MNASLIIPQQKLNPIACPTKVSDYPNIKEDAQRKYVD